MYSQPRIDAENIRSKNLFIKIRVKIKNQLQTKNPISGLLKKRRDKFDKTNVWWNENSKHNMTEYWVALSHDMLNKESQQLEFTSGISLEVRDLVGTQREVIMVRITNLNGKLHFQRGLIQTNHYFHESRGGKLSNDNQMTKTLPISVTFERKFFNVTYTSGLVNKLIGECR